MSPAFRHSSLPVSYSAWQLPKEHAEIIGADGGLVATVDDKTVRLSANADVAVTFEQEEDTKS